MVFFFSKTWRFSYVSFTWSALANAIVGKWFPLWSNTVFKVTLNESKASIAQRCVQAAVLPLILGCFFSTLYHRPLSSTLLCLTSSSYQVILLHLSQEDFTAEAMIQVAECLFFLCDNYRTASSWKEASSIWDIVWDNIILHVGI